VNKLLAETKWYYNNVLDYWSGILCYLCSPTSRNYFQFINGSFVIRQNPDTCYNVFKWYKYSAGVIKFFNSYLFPLVEFLRCSANKIEDPNFALYMIDDPTFFTAKNEIKICSDDLKVTDRQCYKKCTPNFYNFDIKYNFLRNFKQSLKSKSSII
jgi:hypothetical protein